MGDGPEPELDQPLPNAEDAYIDEDKLRRYALYSESEEGQHKATVFELALNIGPDDWEYVRDTVLERLPDCDVYVRREAQSERGLATFGVLVPITGLGDKSDRELPLVTAWKMIDDRPHLTTMRVADERLQRKLGWGTL